MVVHGGKPKIRHKIIVDGIVVYGSSMGATKKYICIQKNIPKKLQNLNIIKNKN